MVGSETIKTHKKIVVFLVLRTSGDLFIFDPF